MAGLIEQLSEGRWGVWLLHGQHRRKRAVLAGEFCVAISSMNVLPQQLGHKGCLSLTLANRLQWHFLTMDESVAPWVKNLAAIMNFSVSQNSRSPKFMFVYQESFCAEDFSQRELTRIMDHLLHLPRQGWKEQNLGIVRFWRHPESQDIICAIRGNYAREVQVTQMWTALSPVYDAVQDSGGLLFHAGLAELDGSGALLVGPSGAGKSTCSRRMPPPWHPLCDDEVLLVRDDLNQYHAHPFPTWQELIRGKKKRSWHVQQHVRLKALFFLNRSSVDEVRPIAPETAAVWIYKSLQEMRERHDFSVTPAEEKALTLKLFENACMLAKSVPCFKLDVMLTGQFWKKMEQVL